MLRVGCIQRLAQKADGAFVLLERDPVEGSVCAVMPNQKRAVIQEVTGRKVLLEQEGGGAFVSYCPWLDMRVVSFSLTTNEWGLKAGWRLALEEA